MAKSILRDKNIQPDEGLLDAVLASAKPMWDAFVAHVAEACPRMTQEWKHYGSAWGWCLVLSDRKKKLVYLTPAEGYFTCSFVFGDKSRELARVAGLDRAVLEIIEAGKENTAGHTFDIDVTDAASLALPKQLMGIKLAS